MSIQKQVTYTKHVYCEGTVTLDEDTLYERFVENIDISRELELDGTTATIRIEIDIEDMVTEQVETDGTYDEQELSTTIEDIEVSD